MFAEIFFTGIAGNPQRGIVGLIKEIEDKKREEITCLHPFFFDLGLVLT